MKYKLTLAYDGTCYAGWQTQHNGQAIQPLVEAALTTLLRTPTAVTSAGRTDAGVHALAQVAHFSYTTDIDIQKLLYSLNALLPPDIRALALEETDDSFHARFSAKRKIYHYHIHLDPIFCPFKRAYSTPAKLDKALLKQAASLFVGTHDFSSFAHKAHEGSAAKNPVRTLYRLDVIEEMGGVRLEFEGNGFLYKMVRNITGMLIDVASSRRSLDDIPKVFSYKDRRLSSRTAPACGLFLVSILYEERELTPGVLTNDA